LTWVDSPATRAAASTTSTAMTADIFTNLTNHFAGMRRFCLLWVAEQNGGALEFCTRNFLAIVHRQIQAKVVHRTDRMSCFTFFAPCSMTTCPRLLRDGREIACDRRIVDPYIVYQDFVFSPFSKSCRGHVALGSGILSAPL
jgi:hypothetical protein